MLQLAHDFMKHLCHISFSKKYLLFVFGALLCTQYLCAQHPNANHSNDYYRTQYTKLHKAYLADTNDVLVMVKLSRFYADQSNPMSSLPFAMSYVSRAENRYSFMLESNHYDNILRKLINKGITLRSIRDEKQSISDAALKKLQTEEMSVIEIDQYIDVFSNYKTIVQQAGLRRVDAAYREVLRINTISAYTNFIKQYPSTNEAHKAEQHISIIVDSLYSASYGDSRSDSILAAFSDNPIVRQEMMRRQSTEAYKKAQSLNTVEAYRSFLSDYPSSTYTIQALEQIDTLLAQEYATIRSATDYVRFAKDNQESPIAEKAIDRVYELAMHGDVQAARLFLSSFKDDSRYVDVFRRLYELYSQEGSYQLISRFKETYTDYPFQNSLNNDLNEAADIESLDLTKAYNDSLKWRYEEFLKSFSSKRISYVALQRLLQPALADGRYDDAAKQLDDYRSRISPLNQEAFDSLYSIIVKPLNPESTPSSLLFPDTEVSSAIVHPSTGEIYYTLSHDSTPVIHILMPQGYDSKSWTHRDVVIKGCAENSVLLFSFFDEASQLIFGQMGDILIAQRQGDVWHLKEKPGYPLNTEFVESDAFMLPDGSGLLIASDRPDGYNIQASGSLYHGDTALASDIYYVARDGDGWASPINLGNAVNSCYSERCPLLSPDRLTLYFLSDKPGSLGFADIFVSSRTDPGDWCAWSNPINLGKEANTPYPEASLSFVGNSSISFLSCHSDKRVELRRVGLHQSSDTVPDYVAVLLPTTTKGVISIDLYDPETTEKVYQDNGSTAKQVYLQKGRPYSLVAQVKDRWVPLHSIIGGERIVDDAFSVPISNLANKTYQLNYVRLDHSNILSSKMAMIELNHLANFLALNPSLRIDLIVRVAGINKSDCYNKSLAYGEQVRAYLADKGVHPERTSVLGYGNLDYQVEAGSVSISVRFNQ